MFWFFFLSLTKYQQNTNIWDVLVFAVTRKFDSRENEKKKECAKIKCAKISWTKIRTYCRYLYILFLMLSFFFLKYCECIALFLLHVSCAPKDHVCSCYSLFIQIYNFLPDPGDNIMTKTEMQSPQHQNPYLTGIWVLKTTLIQGSIGVLLRNLTRN